MSESTPTTPQTSQVRETRRQHLLQALRGEANRVLERLADELVDLPDDKVFGAIEYTLRDLSHDFAARAHQVGVEADKKRATKAPASSVRIAPATPGSSTTEKRPG